MIPVIMKWCVNISLYFFSFIAVANIPMFFYKDESYGFFGKQYMEGFLDTMSIIFSPGDIMLFSQQLRPLPFFETIQYAMKPTLSLIFIALLLILFFTCILVISYIMASIRIKKNITRFIELVRCVPDLLFIALLQMFSIFVYSNTNILLFKVATYGEDMPYFIISLSISLVPTLFLANIFITLIDEEYNKTYVELVKAKGFSPVYIFFRHILKNILPYLSGYIKSFYAVLVSNLFINELFFNTNGLMSLIKMNFYNPPVIFSIIIILSIPYFLLSLLLNAVNYTRTGFFTSGGRI